MTEIIEFSVCDVVDTLARKIDTMIPHPIFNDRADADDIRFRIEDLEHVFESSLEALDKMARDLNQRVSSVSKADVKAFSDVVSDAFNQLIAEFNKAANEEEEDFGRPGRRRGTLTLFARRPQ